MKLRNFKKLFAVLLSAALLLGLLPVEALADAAPAENTRRTGYIYVQPKGSRSASRAAAENNGRKRATNLPSSYNSNTLGYVTSVKSQEYGDCWAHAAMASSESYMIKHGVKVGVNGEVTGAATTNLNLSENHHAFFTYSTPYDALGMLAGDTVTYSGNKYDDGGNGYFSMMSLMRWTGPGNEATSALAYNRNLNKSSSYAAEYAYAYDGGHVMNVLIVPTSNRDAMKQAIMEYGAGDFSYYSSAESTCYNESTAAYYCPQTATYNAEYDYYEYDYYADHAVTVVGWDDDFAVSNFKSGKRPQNPGAWIIKNSWGTQYGDNGYYYISYEDTASYYEDTFFYAVEPIDNYDNIYQYDGTVNIMDDQTLASGSSIATVYTANGTEELKAVALATWDENVSYTMDIYTGCTTASPVTGTKAATKSGTLELAGYQKITLDAPVSLTAGERYAIVFKLTCEDGLLMPTDPVGTSTNSDWGITFKHVQHANSSYVKKGASGSWSNVSANYNFRIKAYTDDVQEDPVPVTMVYHVGTGTAPASATGTAGVTTVTLPTPSAPTGWSFSGWAAASVAETTDKPAMYPAGSSFRLTAAITDLYAVYQKTEQGTGSSTAYTKATSISVGDTVVLVCEGASEGLGSISSTSTKYGVGADLDSTMSGLMTFTVTEGLNEGKYAFKNSDDKYLYWSSGNSLDVSITLNNYTSWYVTFDSDGNAAITNAFNDARQIWWNVSSPRFACYTGKSAGTQYYAVQLYRQGPGLVTTYNSNPIECDHEGFGTTTSTVEAGCTTPGATIVTCNNCGQELSRTEIPALGHLPAAVYSSDETNHFHGCTRCGLSVGDEEAHTFSAWEETTPATADEDGEKTCACTVCGYEKSETIPALGHDYTVTYSVPNGVAAIAPMVCNSNASITLPQAADVTVDEVVYTFIGWVTETADHVSTLPAAVLTGEYTPNADVVLKALYSYSEGGEASYQLVESAPSDWSGDYLIAADSETFADGQVGGTANYGIGAQNVYADPEDALSADEKTVSAEWGDLYNVTFEAVSGGYLMKTKDGMYNYQSSNSNGVLATTNRDTAANYPLSIAFNSADHVSISVSGTEFRHNTQGYFRFYKNNGGTQNPVYLYRRAGGPTEYTTVISTEVTSVTGINLALSGEIRVSAYVTIPDTVIESGIYYAIDGGESTRLTLSDKTENGYVFSARMPAKEMYTPITVSFTDGDGDPVTIYRKNEPIASGEFSFCIHDYIDLVISFEAQLPAKLVDLCKAMSDYGYYAQIVKDYHTDEGTIAPEQYFANDGTTYEAITAASLDDYAYAILSPDGSGISASSGSVEMLSNTSIRIYFNVPAFVSAEDEASYETTILSGGEPYETFTAGRRYEDDAPTAVYQVVIGNIQPSDLGKAFDVTLSDGAGNSTSVLNYSVYSYIRLALSSGVDGNTEKLVKSLYVYGEKAKTYVQ